MLECVEGVGWRNSPNPPSRTFCSSEDICGQEPSPASIHGSCLRPFGIKSSSRNHSCSAEIHCRYIWKRGQKLLQHTSFTCTHSRFDGPEAPPQIPLAYIYPSVNHYQGTKDPKPTSDFLRALMTVQNIVQIRDGYPHYAGVQDNRLPTNPNAVSMSVPLVKSL